jgi:Flp pilus assembly protein TadD
LPELRARNLKIFLAIVAVALVVRIIYLVDVADSPYAGHPLLDSYWYDAKARAVLDGDVLSRGGSFRVPLYTYFLAGLYAVSGGSYSGPLVAQILIGALTCGLVFVMGRRLFGTVAGAFAGFGLALYGMAIYSDGEILPTTLSMLFTVSAVYFALKALERYRGRDGVLAGLCVGLAYLTRPEVLIFAAALGAGALVAKGKRAFRLIALLGIVLAMTMTAMALRNRAIFGEFYWFSPQGAVNLYVGNALYSDGKSPVAPPTRFPYAVAADPADDAMIVGCHQAALERTGRKLSERELSGYYTRRTIAEIREDPAHWLGLLARKTWYFFNAYEISDIKYLPRYVSKYSAVLRLPLVNFAVVMPLGLVGFWLVVRRRMRQAWIVAAAFLGVGLTSIIFFVVWRFRLPAVPFLLVLGGYTVSEMVGAVRRRSARGLLILAVPVAVLTVLSTLGLSTMKRGEHVATYVANEAALFTIAGRPEQAIEVYKEAIVADPTDARPYYYIGKAYASMGMIPQAKEMLDKAMTVSPSYAPFALLSTGIAYANQGNFADASGYFKRATEADPSIAMAWYDYGLSLFKVGKHAEAEEALLQAETAAKGDPVLLLSSAQILTELGRAEKGAAMAQAVLRQNPRNGQACFVLGVALKKLGRLAEARAQFEMASAYARTPQEKNEARQQLLGLESGQLQR